MSIERSKPLQQSWDAFCITWDPGGSIIQTQKLKVLSFEKNPQWYFSERLKRRILRFVVVKKFVESFVNYFNKIITKIYPPSWLKILAALSAVNWAWVFLGLGLFKLSHISKWTKNYSIGSRNKVIELALKSIRVIWSFWSQFALKSLWVIPSTKWFGRYVALGHKEVAVCFKIPLGHALVLLDAICFKIPSGTFLSIIGWALRPKPSLPAPLIRQTSLPHSGLETIQALETRDRACFKIPLDQTLGQVRWPQFGGIGPQWKFNLHHFKKPRPWVPGAPIVPKPPWLKRWPMLVMKRASEPSAISLSGIYCNQHREKTDSPRIRPRPGGLISWQNHFGLDSFRKSRAVKTARFDNKQPFLGGEGLGGPGPLASGFDGPGLAGGGSGGPGALVEAMAREALALPSAVWLGRLWRPPGWKWQKRRRLSLCMRWLGKLWRPRGWQWLGRRRLSRYMWWLRRLWRPCVW